MNPDEIPLPVAIPVIVVLWVIWLTPYAREAIRRRAVSRFYSHPTTHRKENTHV